MKNIFTFIIAFVFFGTFALARAQDNQGQIDYGNNVILDSDLDGLTDEGEKQIFHTDPERPDTDGDGIFDGAEILNKTDPLNINEPRAVEIVLANEQQETPWAWYITRSTGIIGFIMLYLSFFFGLTIKTPIIKKILNPADSLLAHRWTSIQAIIFSIIHGTAPIFDKFITFSWKDVFIPFYLNPTEIMEKAGVTKEAVAFGTLALYLILILTLSSYLRKFIPTKVWRFLHSFNVIIYILVVAHALTLGTDLKSGIVYNIFIGANVLLGGLIVFNIVWRVWHAIKFKLTSKNANLR